MAGSMAEDHKSLSDGIQEVARENSGCSTVVKAVENVALAAATAEQKPSLWTWRMFQLYVCLMLATLNAAVNGFVLIFLVVQRCRD